MSLSSLTGRAIRQARSCNFFLKFLDRKPELWHSGLSLDERRFARRRKAAVPASHGANEGRRLNGRDREMIVRLWKGWRLSACPKARNRLGLFQRAQLASHRIDRLSCPGPQALRPKPGSLRLRSRTARPPSRQMAPRVRVENGASPSFASRLEEPEHKKRQTNPQPAAAAAHLTSEPFCITNLI
jgi:hypothetical protein